MEETALNLFDPINQPISVCVDCLGVDSWAIWLMPNTLMPSIEDKPQYKGSDPKELLKSVLEELENNSIKYTIKMSDAAKIVLTFEQ